jgi:hypothetical protein
LEIGIYIETSGKIVNIFGCLALELGTASSRISGASSVESTREASIRDARTLIVEGSANGSVADDTDDAESGRAGGLSSGENLEILHPGTTRGASTHIRTHDDSVGENRGASLAVDAVHAQAGIEIARIAQHGDVISAESSSLPTEVTSVVSSEATGGIGAQNNESVVSSIGNTTATAEPGSCNIETSVGPGTEWSSSSVVGGDDQIVTAEMISATISRVDAVTSSSNDTYKKVNRRLRLEIHWVGENFRTRTALDEGAAADESNTIV